MPRPKRDGPPSPNVWIPGGTGALGDLIDCMGDCLGDNQAAEKALCTLGLTGVGNWPVKKPPELPGAGIPGMDKTRLINRLLKGRFLRCCKLLPGSGVVIPAGAVAGYYEIKCLWQCLSS